MGGTLRLSRMKNEHASQAFELLESSRGYLEKWIPWVKNARSEGDMLEFIRENQAPHWYQGRVLFGIWLDSELAGMIDLHNGDANWRSVDIGYWIGERFQGMGLVTKSCDMLIGRVFEVSDAQHVFIRCDRNNAPSQRIPERLGFALVGQEKEEKEEGDGHWDLLVYGMRRHRWSMRISEPDKVGRK
ncbi:putative ribosomal N-acetyltransferase YdaF [Fulvitalea axinellae]|uniref:Ribosomal N-acetyltransferase YdaF n=1 Tax=Fulvitalea axinellae TaxID=1182444 RepID=A0AAU9DC16_9BACT|nr:putative ribosomal N-acetyltransferase YdaF [Fulvitalea axinellae]